jgi:hypothetical protein
MDYWHRLIAWVEFYVRCKIFHAAMQTNELRLASGIPMSGTARLLSIARNAMSKTASLGFTPSSTWFSRLVSVIDRVLMANARIANRNGDLPYFGL